MRRDADSRWRRRGPARRLVTAAAALGFSIPLAGCGLLSYGVTVTAPSVMTVSEAAFTHNVLPQRFTCVARNPGSPPLTWAGTPAGTKSIAIVFDDADAPITPYVYWVVYDIGPGTTALLEGQVPHGARHAANTVGTFHYDAPCPGANGHNYRFTVYALNKVLNLPNGASLESAWEAIAAATIGRGRLQVSATS